MNVAEFIDKWRKVELTERSAAQQHFLGLCRPPRPPEARRGGPHRRLADEEILVRLLALNLEREGG